MRSLFLGVAALAFIVGIGIPLLVATLLGNVGNYAISIPLAIISAGIVISGGLALVAAAIAKDDK